jgi:hypothetical protein
MNISPKHTQVDLFPVSSHYAFDKADTDEVPGDVERSNLMPFQFTGSVAAAMTDRVDGVEPYFASRVGSIHKVENANTFQTFTLATLPSVSEITNNYPTYKMKYTAVEGFISYMSFNSTNAYNSYLFRFRGKINGALTDGSVSPEYSLSLTREFEQVCKTPGNESLLLAGGVISNMAISLVNLADGVYELRYSDIFTHTDIIVKSLMNFI